jgi:hypothetical protein
MYGRMTFAIRSLVRSGSRPANLANQRPFLCGTPIRSLVRPGTPPGLGHWFPWWPSMRGNLVSMVSPAPPALPVPLSGIYGLSRAALPTRPVGTYTYPTKIINHAI